MNYVDLFTGIGGFALAASLVWENEFNPVMFCEIDLFCRRVLGKHWPDVPIIEDVRDEKAIADATRQYDRIPPRAKNDRQKPQSGSRVVKGIDLLCGGPPCQPSSCAGLRKGAEDPRFLWPQALRAVEITKPEWIIFENPTGLLSLNGGMEYESICARLERAGYWVEGFVVPASAVGAWHRRDRVWIIAENIERFGLLQGSASQSGQEGWEAFPGNRAGIVARNEVVSERAGLCEGIQKEERGGRSGDQVGFASNNDCTGLQVGEMQSGIFHKKISEIDGDPWDIHWLQAVEQFCGVADGLSNRVDRHRRDRIKALGNSIVPQVAIRIMRAIQAADYAEIA
jgi:DNA (cytosine-5)-methyltransferase 1